VQTVTVGALHDQDVGAVGEWNGVTNYWDISSSDIAAEHKAPFSAGLLVFDVEDDMCAAQHVTCIDQGEMDTGEKLMAPVVAQTHELLHGFGRIGLGIEGLEEALAFLLATAIDEFHVLLLDKGAVHEHNGTQVPGCRCAENVTVKTVLDETGDTTRVINVGMGKNQAVDGFAITQFTAVSLVGLLTLALEQAAVEQDFFVVYLEHVLGSGDGLGGSLEGNFHGVFLFRRLNRWFFNSAAPSGLQSNTIA